MLLRKFNDSSIQNAIIAVDHGRKPLQIRATCRRSVILTLGMLLALLACRRDEQACAADNLYATPDDEAIAKFLTTYSKTQPADRRKYVTNTEDFDAGQERYYRNFEMPDNVQFTVRSVKAGPKPNYLTVRAQRKVVIDSKEKADMQDYFLLKTKDGLKMDWSAGIGYNAAGIMAWRAGKDDTLTLRVTARLSDLYGGGYEDANETHYSIVLFDMSSGREVKVWGYVLKESQLGRRLFEILKDEQNHDVIVTIERTTAENTKNGYFSIKTLVSDTWVK